MCGKETLLWTDTKGDYGRCQGAAFDSAFKFSEWKNPNVIPSNRGTVVRPLHRPFCPLGRCCMISERPFLLAHRFPSTMLRKAIGLKGSLAKHAGKRQMALIDDLSYDWGQGWSREFGVRLIASVLTTIKRKPQVSWGVNNLIQSASGSRKVSRAAMLRVLICFRSLSAKADGKTRLDTPPCKHFTGTERPLMWLLKRDMDWYESKHPATRFGDGGTAFSGLKARISVSQISQSCCSSLFRVMKNWAERWLLCG